MSYGKENADFLLEYAKLQGITSNKELSNFMGQMQVESKNFTSFEESMHYSGKRLHEVFPGRNGMDSVAKANEIVKGGPEKIADAVYGGEWGKSALGNINADDGWRFHGRGYIQLTGRNEYAAVGKELGLDLVNNPDLVSGKEVAAKTAVQYWKDNVVRLGFQEDIDKTTYSINKAGEGLHERRAAAAAWEHKLEQGYVPGALEPAVMHTLKQGMHNEQVQKLQTQLGELGYLDNTVTPDGKFGTHTRDAVKAFEHDHHLPEVGQAGPATQRTMQADLQPLKQNDPGLLPSVSAMSSLPAAAPGLDDPRHALNPDNALYNKLKTTIPDASEQRLLQFTAACHEQNITDNNLNLVHFNQKDGLMAFASGGLTPSNVTVDVKQPSPPTAESIQQIQTHDGKQIQLNHQIQTQIQTQNAQAPQGPMPGGSPMPGGMGQ